MQKLYYKKSNKKNEKSKKEFQIFNFNTPHYSDYADYNFTDSFLFLKNFYHKKFHKK